MLKPMEQVWCFAKGARASTCDDACNVQAAAYDGASHASEVDLRLGIPPRCMNRRARHREGAKAVNLLPQDFYGASNKCTGSPVCYCTSEVLLKTDQTTVR